MDCLKKQKLRFLTVEQLMKCLADENITVGYTTAYRFPERMAEEGKVMKLPTEDGAKVRYCFANEDDLSKPGKLVAWAAAGLSPWNVLKCRIFWNISMRNMATKRISSTQFCMAIVNAVKIRALVPRAV